MLALALVLVLVPFVLGLTLVLFPLYYPSPFPFRMHHPFQVSSFMEIIEPFSYSIIRGVASMPKHINQN